MPGRTPSPDRLRLGVTANYASQFYVAAISIALVPVYLRYLGAEAYGLVGFFALLQAWFQFLDMGLSGTLSREAARLRGGATSADEFRALFSALQRIFVVIALVAGGAVVASSGFIATRWLQVEALPLKTVAQSVALMGLALPLRWLSGLYRGVVGGFERQVWLGGFGALVATLRFALVIPLLAFVSASVLAFFWFQLAVSALEVLALGWMAHRHLPRPTPGDRPARWFAPLRKTFGFSVYLSLATVAWLLITQTDKLLLSAALPLAAYGQFTLAVMLASAVSMLAGPIGQAVLPRLTRLEAEGAHAEALGLYRRATQWLCIVAAPASLTLAFFGEQVLFAWTGDAALARGLAPVLALYAAGNGVLAVGAMPYCLQHAQGKLRLHTVGTLLLAAALVPAMALATGRAGALGAGMVWLGAMTSYLLLWTPIAHHRCAPGLQWPWLLRDIGAVAVPGAVVVWLAARLVPWPASRLGMATQCALIFGAAVMACAAASPSARHMAAEALRWILRRSPAPSR